jgi:spoIIIJ-associated protein
MKDRVFEGRDVEQALRLAEDTFGVPRGGFSHVVLEEGGGPDSGAGPARIAVLGGSVVEAGPAEQPEEPLEPEEAVLEIVDAIGRAAGVELVADLKPERNGLRVRLSGPGHEMLLAHGARGLKALDQLLQRSFYHCATPKRVVLECEGYSEQREQELRDLAKELAAGVRQDGQLRMAPPLNSYERRLVHLALEDEAGVRSYSEGEGAGRRLVIALVADDGEARLEG